MSQPQFYRRSVIALLLLIVPLCGLAQTNPAKASEKASYEKELAQTKREKPAEYESTRAMFTMFTELLLGRLGYDVGVFDGVADEKFQAALRRYQKNRHIPVTGDPTSFETTEQVSADTANLDYEPVGLPPLYVYVDAWERGYVGAKGTWTIAGETSGNPEQTSDISCYRDLAYCIEATAIVSRSFGGPFVSVSTDTYEIERWDQQEIVTKPLQFGCVRYVRRFNRTQRSVTGIRSTTSNDGECKAMENAEKFLVLKDGVDVKLQLMKKQTNTFRELMQISPAMWKILDAGRKD